jgi:ATP-dependent Clp protease ATP-binding subunit ClpA
MQLAAPFQGMKALKSLVTQAQQRAAAMGDGAVGAEHLLLAALTLPDGGARRTFERAGADPDGFEAAIADQHAAALRTVGIETIPDEAFGAAVPRGATRMSESLARVLRVVAEGAKAERNLTLGASVVLAVAEMELGTAPRALRVMGVDRAELAAAARAELAAARG